MFEGIFNSFKILTLISYEITYNDLGGLKLLEKFRKLLQSLQIFTKLVESFKKSTMLLIILIAFFAAFL